MSDVARMKPPTSGSCPWNLIRIKILCSQHMNLIIGLIANVLLWEVLHDRQCGRSLLFAVLTGSSEVEARVLLLSLDHLDVAGDIIILLIFLDKFLPNDQGSAVLFVGWWCLWSTWGKWLGIINRGIILNKIDAGNAGLIRLLFWEVLNNSQSSFLILIIQFF